MRGEGSRPHVWLPCEEVKSIAFICVRRRKQTRAVTKPLVALANAFKELQAAMVVKRSSPVFAATSDEIQKALADLEAFLSRATLKMAEFVEHGKVGSEGNASRLDEAEGLVTTGQFHLSGAKLAKARWEAILKSR